MTYKIKERDKQIFLDVINGMTLKAAGKISQISSERVRQIISRTRWKLNRFIFELNSELQFVSFVDLELLRQNKDDYIKALESYNRGDWPIDRYKGNKK